MVKYICLQVICQCFPWFGLKLLGLGKKNNVVRGRERSWFGLNSKYSKNVPFNGTDIAYVIMKNVWLVHLQEFCRENKSEQM